MNEREKAARAEMRVEMEDRRVAGKGGEGRKAEEKDGKGKEKGKRATQAGGKNKLSFLCRKMIVQKYLYNIYCEIL